MKKFLIVGLVICLGMSLSVFAQEKKEMKKETMKTEMQEEMTGETHLVLPNLECDMLQGV